MGEWDYVCPPLPPPPAPLGKGPLGLQIAIEADQAKQDGRELSAEDVLKISNGAISGVEAEKLASQLRDQYVADDLYSCDRNSGSYAYCGVIGILHQGFGDAKNVRNWQKGYLSILDYEVFDKKPYRAFKAQLQVASRAGECGYFPLSKNSEKFFSSMSAEEREDIVPDLRQNIFSTIHKMDSFEVERMVVAVGTLTKLGTNGSFEEIFSDPYVTSQIRHAYEEEKSVSEFCGSHPYRGCGDAEAAEYAQDAERIKDFYAMITGEPLYPSEFEKKAWGKLEGGWNSLRDGTVGLGKSSASASHGWLSSFKSYFHIK